MLQECKEKWYAKVEMDDLILHEIYFMIRDSLRANESELFFTAVRLSLPLFAVTNAYRYLRIAFELLLWRSTASEEELHLFEAFAFTRETEHGNYQAVDLCQEKINLKFRQKLGSKVLPGHERQMKNIAIDLNTGKNKSSSQTTKRNPILNESFAHKNWEKIYAEVRLHMDSTQVWKKGLPVLFRDGKEVPPDCVVSPTGAFISNHIITWLPKGINRCKDYFSIFYENKENRNAVKRQQSYANGGVPTKKILTTEQEYKADCDRRIKLATSLSKQDIIKASGNAKETIKAEIVYTCNTLLQEPPHDVDLQDLPHTLDGLSALLVKIRKRWISKDVIERVARIEREKEATTSREQREETLEHEDIGCYYRAHPEIAAQFSSGDVNLKFCV